MSWYRSYRPNCPPSGLCFSKLARNLVRKLIYWKLKKPLKILFFQKHRFSKLARDYGEINPLQIEKNENLVSKIILIFPKNANFLGTFSSSRMVFKLSVIQGSHLAFLCLWSDFLSGWAVKC
jgi:hypothetical protein